MNCESHLNDSLVLVAYGLEPGGARRMQWENRIHKELAPTLRENMGDNQAAVIVICEPKVFDARGNGGGEVCPTITGEHQNRVTDYTAIVVTTHSPASGSTLNEQGH